MYRIAFYMYAEGKATLTAYIAAESDEEAKAILFNSYKNARIIECDKLHYKIVVL